MVNSVTLKTNLKCVSFCFVVWVWSTVLNTQLFFLVFLMPHLREMTIPASSWIQLWASSYKGQLCGLQCFNMQATPGPLGCDPLFCQQPISVAVTAVTEQLVTGAQAQGVCQRINIKAYEWLSEGTPATYLTKGYFHICTDPMSQRFCKCPKHSCYNARPFSLCN